MANTTEQALKFASAEAATPVAYAVFDGKEPIYSASYASACHEHINDAINEFHIEGAEKWKVTPLYAAPQSSQPIGQPKDVIAFDDAAVRDFVEGYECDTGEGIYTPTKHERWLIDDAIRTFLEHERSDSNSQPVTDAIENAAKVLWNRFAPSHNIEWEDEPHKAEYIDAARSILSASGQAVSEVERLTLEIQNERELHKHWRAKAHTARNAGLESAANKCLSMNYYSHDTRREFANAVLALSSTPAQTEAPVNVPSVDAVIKQSKAVLRLVDEYIDGVQTQQTRTRLRSALMDLFAAAPAQAQTEAQQSEYEIPRVIAFIEQLDKSLEAAGYSHEQRLEITGILMSTKVAAIAKEKAK